MSEPGTSGSTAIEPGEAVDPAVARSEALTRAEAAWVLGCSPDEVSQLLNGGPRSRESVEQLAAEHYRWRRHVDNPESYWVTLKQASAILGVSTQRLKQLLDSGEVPCVVHRDGVRLMRREELDAAARVAEKM